MSSTSEQSNHEEFYQNIKDQEHRDAAISDEDEPNKRTTLKNTSPVRPTHFHHPRYIEEINNNTVTSPVVQSPQRRQCNVNPESGIDRTSIIINADAWNNSIANQTQNYYQRSTSVSLTGTWYTRWQDKETEDELERIERRKENLRRKSLDQLRKLPCSMGRMVLQEQTILEARMVEEVSDPRLSSRSPGANASLPSRPRYNSPVNSSPSRTLREARDYGLGLSFQNLNTQNDGNMNCSRDGSLINDSEDEVDNSTFIHVNNETAMSKGESMPNIAAGRNKIFPYHILSTLNNRLPKGVDRTCLEKHLTVTEFEQIFLMSRDKFWRLPKWKRMEMKKKVHLF